MSDNTFSESDTHHGGIDFEELARRGVSPECVIDFSSNVLPFGPSPQVQSAVRQVPLDRYPDREAGELRRTLAELHGIDQHRILAGNGCSELIHLVANCLLGSGDHVLVVGPTFSEYRRATRFASADVHECRARVGSGFEVPVEEVFQYLETRPIDLVWICNPNNPTGKSLRAETILSWIRFSRRTLFVVDESYMEFSGAAESLVREEFSNLVVLRSMTKSMAIAGLRLGYLVAPREVISRLRRRLVPWSVNALAQAAGVAAIRDREHYANAISRLWVAKAQFLSDLANGGFRPVPSDANYFLLPVDDAAVVREQLLSQGILVRDCASFGIKDHLRLAVRGSVDNRRLCKLLSSV